MRHRGFFWQWLATLAPQLSSFVLSCVMTTFGVHHSLVLGGVGKHTLDFSRRETRIRYRQGMPTESEGEPGTPLPHPYPSPSTRFYPPSSLPPSESSEQLQGRQEGAAPRRDLSRRARHAGHRLQPRCLPVLRLQWKQEGAALDTQNSQ